MKYFLKAVLVITFTLGFNESRANTLFDSLNSAYLNNPKLNAERANVRASEEEKNEFYRCDKKKCKLEGRYKAPKSKLNVRNYYYFCLKHVKEYNKSWDYYKNMSVSQIELSLRQDVIWDRPSWPTKGSSSKILNTINSIFSDDFRIRSKRQKFLNHKKDIF